MLAQLSQVRLVLQQRGVLRRCRAQARHLLRPGLQCQHRVSWAAFAVPRGLHARAHHAARAALFACGRRLLPRQASYFLDVTGAFSGRVRTWHMRRLERGIHDTSAVQGGGSRGAGHMH